MQLLRLGLIRGLHTPAGYTENQQPAQWLAQPPREPLSAEPYLRPTLGPREYMGKDHVMQQNTLNHAK